MKCFSPALRDDVVFNAMGRCPIAGHYEGKRVYSEEVLAKLHDRLLVNARRRQDHRRRRSGHVGSEFFHGADDFQPTILPR